MSEKKNGMINCLKKYKIAKEIVSVYDDEDRTSAFSAGYIVDVTDTYTLAALISPLGQYDGYKTFETDDIYAVQHGGKYERKVSTLHALRSPHIREHLEVESTGDVMRDIIAHAKKHSFIVSIQAHESGYNDCRGFVLSLDTDSVYVLQVDEYGQRDGYTTLRASDITHIFCDTDTEAAIKMLYDNCYSAEDEENYLP